MSDADVGQALARLARSRDALRQRLLPPPDDAATPGAGSFLPRRWRAWLRAGPLRPLTRALEPWVESTRRTAQRWWRRHPWRPSMEFVGGSVQRQVSPWMRRHPYGAVGIGAAAGAALVVAAPWRAPTVQRAFANGGARARRWMLRQLTSPAAQTVLAGLVTTWLTTQPRPAPSAPAADDGTAAAP
jgi:hypothetical protein